MSSAVDRFEVEIPSDTALGLEVQERILGLLRDRGYPKADVFGARLSLEEAIINAIKHGNKLELTKKVRVICEVDDEHMFVDVEDEGAGFVLANVPDPTLDENLEKPSGRGLMLIKHYMTRVEYLGRGNRIQMEKVRIRQKIVIATDQSAASQLAVAEAAKIPLAAQTSVTLVAVTSLPLPLSEYAIEEDLLDEARDYQREHLDTEIEVEKAAVRTLFPAVETDLRIGDPATEIAACAVENEAEVIVCGARGQSTFDRLLLGSVSEGVIREASCPVLIARAAAAPGGKSWKQVLIAFDGSASARAAIAALATRPLSPDTRFTIVTVAASSPLFLDKLPLLGELWATATPKYHESLAWAETALRAATPNVKIELLRSNHAVEALTDFAKSIGADLVVVGAKGHSTLERLLVGSVCLGVVRHAPCSVWVHKA